MANDDDNEPRSIPSELDAVADGQQADTFVNKVNGSVCATCGAPAIAFCSQCGQDFCAAHRCLMHGDFTTSNEPLIDDEGVERKGRRIRLIGEGWPNHILMVQDLAEHSPEALVEHIQRMQALLDEAIKAVDFAKISIAHAEFELEYQRHSRYVAAIKRREKIEQGAIKLGTKRVKATASQQALGPDGKPIPADIAALMQAFKINYPTAIAMKTLLAAQKKS